MYRVKLIGTKPTQGWILEHSPYKEVSWTQCRDAAARARARAKLTSASPPYRHAPSWIYSLWNYKVKPERAVEPDEPRAPGAATQATSGNKAPACLCEEAQKKKYSMKEAVLCCIIAEYSYAFLAAKEKWKLEDCFPAYELVPAGEREAGTSPNRAREVRVEIAMRKFVGTTLPGADPALFELLARTASRLYSAGASKPAAVKLVVSRGSARYQGEYARGKLTLEGDLKALLDRHQCPAYPCVSPARTPDDE